MAQSTPKQAASREPQVVELAPATYLAIDGSGPPGTPTFHGRIEVLFHVALAAETPRGEGSFRMTALETLWWAEGDAPMETQPPEKWRWRHLVQVPDDLDVAEVEVARKQATEMGSDADLAEDVHIEHMQEGTVIQALHKGPYDGVGPTYEKLFAHMAKEGLRPAGRIHELYLNDPDEVADKDLETVCRIPVALV